MTSWRARDRVIRHILLLSIAGHLICNKNMRRAVDVSKLGKHRVWWLVRVRYDGLDSAVDVEMGSRKIHTLAVRVADYAGAVFPPVVSLLFLPSFHIFSISLTLSVIFACRVFLRIPLSVNVIMGGIEGGSEKLKVCAIWGLYCISATFELL